MLDNPKPPQHVSDEQPNSEVTSIQKNLILTFHSNSFQIGLFVILCPFLEDNFRSSSVITTFTSNSHFSLLSKL